MDAAKFVSTICMTDFGTYFIGMMRRKLFNLKMAAHIFECIVIPPIHPPAKSVMYLLSHDGSEPPFLHQYFHSYLLFDILLISIV